MVIILLSGGSVLISNTTSLVVTDPTAVRTITLPDATYYSNIKYCNTNINQ